MTRTRSTSRSRSPALGHSRLLATVVVVAGVALAHGAVTAAASDGSAAELPVGHTIKRVAVPGTVVNEMRQVDVHLWYPADPADVAARELTVYRSALHVDRLRPGQWPPEPWNALSWSIDAEIAREGAALDPRGGALPAIVFTHGNINDPIDYAHTLERIAAAGFVVAAPYHTGNSQDDVRIDFINKQAGQRLFECNDGLPPRPLPPTGGDCSKSNVPFSMADRVRDISTIIDKLPSWFGDRVNAKGVGVLGHSRGTATALAAAGGSAGWGVEAEPDVEAIMGMAIASRAITTGANLQNVTVPVLLVAGGLDETSPPAVSVEALGLIASADKELVHLDQAVHRSFDSTYCDQMQASAAVFDADEDRVVEASELQNVRPILDRHTFDGLHLFPLSGFPVQYCSFASFTRPIDIRAMVTLPTNFNITADSVPTTELDSDTVKEQMAQLAVEFFSAKLDRDNDDVRNAADNCCDTANADQADADGDGTGDACDPTPRGTIPPAIVVPGHITVDATDPGGATVAYTVTATDDLDPEPTVLCTPPAGSVFAIGDTRVDCVATDTGGNTADAGFLVTVLGAKEQLGQLIAKVIDATSLPAVAKTRLIEQLHSLSAGFDPTNPQQRKAACLALKAFTTVVRFAAPPALAAEWTADANRIRAVLAC